MYIWYALKKKRKMKRMKQRSTITEIALAAGVSVPTVSKVLNQRSDVAQETRLRVEQVIKEKGYVRNRAARALGGGQSGLIDLIVSKPLDSEYFLEIIHGIEEIAQQEGKDIVLTTIQDEAQVDRLEHAADRLTDGVVLLLPRMHEQYVNVFLKYAIPFVVIDNSIQIDSSIPSVGTTNWPGGLAATQYLLSLGHQRIGIIADETHYLMARARFFGYRMALETAGIPFDPLLVREGNFHPEDGLEQTRVLLDLPNPPTAIFAGSDWQAAGVYRAIYERGLSVPADISVIGFDDVPSARWMTPPLTTIRQPLKEMGRTAMTILMKLIANEALETPRVELASSLIIRESCAAPRTPKCV